MTSFRARFLRGAVMSATLLVASACGDVSTDRDTRTDFGPVPFPTTVGLEFKGTVTDVNLPEGTLTLENGQVIDTTGVRFDPEGDVYSLPETASAVDSGATVRAEGNGTPSGDGVIKATSLKIEIDG